MADTVKRIYSDLSKLDSLRPSPKVDRHFRELVNSCLTAEGDVEQTIHQMRKKGVEVADLWRICAEGEIQLEYFWAEKILHSEGSLNDFPYYPNYDRLTDFELEAIKKHRNLTDSKMLYIGNGAIPYTALMFSSKEKGLSVDCLDRDKKARELGAKIFDYVGQAGKFYLDDIADTDLPFERYNILFLCALIGNSNEEKNAILKRIHLKLDKGGLVVVRSVPDDHRRLLYPQFSFSEENMSRYEPLAEYNPPRELEVINSIKLAKPR